MRLYIVYFALLINPFTCTSQNGSFQLGARSAGIGYAATTIHDSYAMFNNISGIATDERLNAVFAYENRFGINEFNVVGTGIIIPNNWGNTCLNILKFGDELYSEKKIGLGYAHKLGMVSLGFQVNYLQLHIENLGTRGTMALEMGLIAEITKELAFGAHVFNFNQATFSTDDNEITAVTLKTGLSYRPIQKLMINLETHKNLDYSAIFRTGIEYEIIKKFNLRAGFSFKNHQSHYGMGFWPGRFKIDYSMGKNYLLGLSHQASVNYILSVNKKEKPN